MTRTPLAYLTSAGYRAARTAPLTWFTLIISVLVCLVITTLVVIASARRHGAGGAQETAAVPVERSADGLPWITWGLIVSAVPLLATLVWTMAALAQVAGPPVATALTIDVAGHQYWWEAVYDGGTPAARFATANEIHIPVGLPVQIRLHGADVIHSFWVPKLAGKTDAIPGQINVTWLQADIPGRYRGQCTEYCGLQHANMAFEVVAEPPAAFERWLAQQRRPAADPTDALAIQGQIVFAHRCEGCHAVAGTPAAGRYGPDLTHLKSRRLIAAGTLPNTIGALAGWIQSPQNLKPGTTMPQQHLAGPDLIAVAAYVETLK